MVTLLLGVSIYLIHYTSRRLYKRRLVKIQSITMCCSGIRLERLRKTMKFSVRTAGDEANKIKLKAILFKKFFFSGVLYWGDAGEKIHRRATKPATTSKCNKTIGFVLLKRICIP